MGTWIEDALARAKVAKAAKAANPPKERPLKGWPKQDRATNGGQNGPPK